MMDFRSWMIMENDSGEVRVFGSEMTVYFGTTEYNHVKTIVKVFLYN